MAWGPAWTGHLRQDELPSPRKLRWNCSSWLMAAGMARSHAGPQRKAAAVLFWRRRGRVRDRRRPRTSARRPTPVGRLSVRLDVGAGELGVGRGGRELEAAQGFREGDRDRAPGRPRFSVVRLSQREDVARYPSPAVPSGAMLNANRDVGTPGVLHAQPRPPQVRGGLGIVPVRIGTGSGRIL